VASTRRLAVIMFARVVGDARPGQRGDPSSPSPVDQQRELLRPVLLKHHGKEVKAEGDVFLTEFSSALEAVRCAYGIQRATRELNASLPSDRRIRLRVGVHLGDVVDSRGDLRGDAVDVASRIEPLADDGGVCLTRPVHDQVQDKFGLPLANLGRRSLKNVAAPVEVYKIVMPWSDAKQLPSTSVDQDRVAVLPFVNIGPNPNDDYFADGLTEELIANLALVKELKVIARTTVMNYKKKPKHVSEIGRELGVRTLVEGSVGKASDRIRVTVQVIDVATEKRLWTSSYDDHLDHVFELERDIAAKVVASLPGTPSVAGTPVPQLSQTRDIQAYLYFLEGQSLVYQREEEPLLQSLKFFERAIERDPTFSRAYAGTARAYIRLGEEGFVPWSEAIGFGRDAAEKARSISPDLAEAYSMLAELSFMADEPVEVLEKDVKRALRLNPNLAELQDILGQIAALKGDLRSYVRHIEAAYLLDPLSPFTIRYLGRAYFYSGREEDALAHWKRTLPLDPFNSYRGMTDYYIAKGDLETAGAMVNEMEKVAPTHELTYLNRGYLAALRGDRATAKRMIAKLDAPTEQRWSMSCSVGFIYLALGDVDQFFEYMFAALNDHTLQLSNLRYSPLFAEVRKDPRFQQLISKENRAIHTSV